MAPGDAFVAIAPARTANTNAPPSQSLMSYSCHHCARRKVRCNKETPSCSSCRKGKLDCFYEAPKSFLRKRKPRNRGVLEKLAKYERILHQHGLLVASDVAGPAGNTDTVSTEPMPSPPSDQPRPPTTTRGRLIADQSKSRYIDSNILHNLGYEEEQEGIYDDDYEHGQDGGLISDPLTGALINPRQNLVQYHPTHDAAMALFDTYINNVEPLCKIIHVPSTAEMIKLSSQHPESISRANECLLFAIYHFSVFSMTDSECDGMLGLSRLVSMQRYRFAAQQALVNASFLKTTEMPVLQALVLFLIASRSYFDSSTYWILTGVAVRIAQRMGLHRDGEQLGLSPFDVQMRRRLFYQLLPLDGNASQMSGVGMPPIPSSWDTKPPLNLNDDQIWPGMTEVPEEQNEATEMIFCLLRFRIGKSLAMLGGPANDVNLGQFKDLDDVELAIKNTENEIEEKFIRYCDIVQPLHFLAVACARSGITAMRLRVGLSKVKNGTATDAERKQFFQFAQKIIDTDTAIYTHPGLQKFRWHVKPFFLWGTWDSLIFVLTSLCKNKSILSQTESSAAWDRIQQTYQSHDELIESKRPLHVALRRLTLKAWDVHKSRNDVSEPAFIALLRSSQDSIRQNQNILGPITNSTSAGDANASLGGWSDDFGLGIGTDPADWAFWDQLVQDYLVQDH